VACELLPNPNSRKKAAGRQVAITKRATSRRSAWATGGITRLEDVAFLRLKDKEEKKRQEVTNLVVGVFELKFPIQVAVAIG
jgi:hypothetical protein